MLYLLVTALLVLMIAFPHAPASKLLHAALVEPAARRLARLKPATAVFWLILFIVVAAVLLDARELLFGFAGIGEAAPMIAMLIDGSITMDLVLVIWLASATSGLAAILRGLRSALLLPPRLIWRAASWAVRRSSRAGRRKRRPSSPPKRPDPDGHPGLWLPAAA